MEKVILIEPVLAHYRKDVFEKLNNSKEFNFKIIAGRSYQGINSLKGHEQPLLHHISFNFLGHNFYYLQGILKYLFKEKPDRIICTGIDFHLLHTLIIFFIHKFILRKKFYWWSHATIGHQGKFGFLMRKIVYKSSSGIFSYNHKGRDNLIQMSVAEKNIEVVNNSLNKEDYGYLNYNLHEAKSSNVFNILYSGRITKAKKIDLLIKALTILKEKNSFDFKCTIIGDGDLDGNILLSKSLNISNSIDFVGAKYGKEAHPYFLNADLFVYPSGIGLSILHSFSFGIPVITTDNMDVHGPEIELLKKDYNGNLFIHESAKDLAEKIIIWRAKIINSKEVYTKNCIQRIKDYAYLPEIMSHKVLNFLKQDC